MIGIVAIAYLTRGATALCNSVQVAKLKTQLAAARDDDASESGESRSSVAGRPSSARPAHGSVSGAGGADYPRLRQQIADKEAEMARMRVESEAAAAEVEKLQASLAKTKRQASVKIQEKDAAIKASAVPCLVF